MHNPYYQDASVTLYHADCMDVLPLLAPASVDLVLTDPPYAAETHRGARSSKAIGQRMIPFTPFTSADLQRVLDLIAPLARRWVISFLDWHHVAGLEDAPPASLRFVRHGIWLKSNGAPQFTGDRPATGWESIVYLHRAGGRMHWHGGGKSGNFTYPVVQGDHPTEKPIRLIKDLIALFSNPGDLILDPFAGVGTTGRAAKDMGRRAILIEQDAHWCEIAARRLSQEVLDLKAA